MTTSTVAPEIVQFARGIREALADLPADEVDDLTEGLEADLAESLAEDLRRTLPDPVAYAAELRSAAGLPAPDDAAHRPFAVVAGAWRSVRASVTGVFDRNPVLVDAVELLDTLRPTWWIVRAWLATWLLAAFFGSENGYLFENGWWLVLVPLVVVSAQWGRRRWPVPGQRGIVLAGNVIAVIAVLPVLNAAQSWGGSGSDYDIGYADGSASSGVTGDGQGLSLDGQPLENIYAYDAAGNKLTGVQLFDVDGKPLVPNRDVDLTQLLQLPATLETGAKAFNVYPLTVTRMTYDGLGDLVPDPNPDSEKAAAYADGPFLKVPAVQPSAALAPEKVAQPNE